MISRYIWLAAFCATLGWGQTPELRIAHAAFRVADLPASRAFYQKLGFEVPFENTRDGKTTQTFIKVNDRQFIELYPRGEDSVAVGLMHVCFESQDLEALTKDYSQHGLKPSAPHKSGMGNLLSTMKDPEDTTIEFTQYIPGSRHVDDRGKHMGAERISEHLVTVVVPAKNQGLVKAFYSKLGPEANGNSADSPLRLPGDSGETLRFGGAKPGLIFVVPDVKRAANQLKARGLAVKTSGSTASVTDPDGVVVTLQAATR